MLSSVEAFLILICPRQVMIPMRKARHFIPISSHQRFLPFPAPTLDLLFARESLFTGWKLLRENQFHGKSRRSIAFKFTDFMFGYAFFEIVCMTGVVRAVRATENVNPETHGSDAGSVFGLNGQIFGALRLGSGRTDRECNSATNRQSFSFVLSPVEALLIFSHRPSLARRVFAGQDSRHDGLH